MTGRASGIALAELPRNLRNSLENAVFHGDGCLLVRTQGEKSSLRGGIFDETCPVAVAPSAVCRNEEQGGGDADCRVRAHHPDVQLRFRGVGGGAASALF